MKYAKQSPTCRLHLHLRSLRFTVSKLLGVFVQTHAGLLLTEGLHFAEQDFLFGSVETVRPAFFRTVSLPDVLTLRISRLQLTASPISNASSSSMQCAYWSCGMGNGMVATPYSGWFGLPSTACIIIFSPPSFQFSDIFRRHANR